jgi:hypothetical protein
METKRGYLEKERGRVWVKNCNFAKFQIIRNIIL